MAGRDNFGCCDLVQGLCGLVEAFLLPRSGGFPAQNPRGLRRNSPQVSRTAGSPWDVGISSRSGHPPALTVGAPRAHPAAGAGRGTGNAHTAQISHLPALTVSASSATRVQSGTSNSHTAPISHPLALTVSAPRASSATRVQSGTSNGHSAQVTHPTWSYSQFSRTGSPWDVGISSRSCQPPALTVGAPRAHPAAGAGRGTSNAHTAQISHPPALTVSASSATRVQSGTSNSHTAPISHPPALTVSAPRASSATRVQSGSKWNSPPQQSDDDDDCVILDSDPHSAVAVTDANEGSARDGGSDEELQIVAEKGKVACRDFPHSRHLCSNMPFRTTSHEKHCTMCYCFVCDAPAPCSYWGKALSVDDHCHATDKETKWKLLRQAFKQRSNGSGTSNGHTTQFSYPLALTVSAPRALPAAGAGRSTINAHTAQISHPQAPTVTAPGASSATRVQSVTRNAHTAQNSHSPALTVSAPRAASATRVQSGTGNGHSAQLTHLVEPTVSTPTPHSEARAGRGTSNGHTALINHPVEPTVSAARTGTGTSNTHTSQITHPVEPTGSGTRAYPAGSTGRGISNAHTAQITRPVEQSVSAPRVYPEARAGRDSSNAQSSQITYPATANGEPDAPEGATVYVGNLPYRIDNERLKLSFQHAGVVLFSKVIYDRETGKSRGFGFVTMNTVQEAEAAVRMYHGSVMYGRPLTVKIAAPRGGARVDTVRRQSGSPIRIFVCNLPEEVDRFRLEELFSKHGKVVDARVVYECRGEDWCSRGFGFVTMATEEESYNAIHALNKQVLEGHALGVKVAREGPERGSPSLSNQTPLQNAVSQNQNTHASVRASLNVAPTVSVPRARSGTSNANTAQFTHQLDPTVSAPRPREHRMLPLTG